MESNVVAPPVLAQDAYGTAVRHGLFTEASRLEWHVNEVVPGVLQTPPYTTALLEGWADWTDDGISRMARHREELRQHLLRPGGARIEAVIGEAALHNHLGGQHVMAEQLRFLANLSGDRVDLRVVPYGVSYTKQTDNYVIVTTLTRERIATEDALHGAQSDSATDIARTRKAFRAAQAAALSPTQSQELMLNLAHSYGS